MEVKRKIEACEKTNSEVLFLQLKASYLKYHVVAENYEILYKTMVDRRKEIEAVTDLTEKTSMKSACK